VSKLAPFQAHKSFAKIALEQGLREVNDFYWGTHVSIGFSRDISRSADLLQMIGSDPTLRNKGHLRPLGLPSLLTKCADDLSKFCVVNLFSYFEPYIRDVAMAAILSNLGLLSTPPVSIDGEEIAGNYELLSL
jgi:hypothetical protein